MYGSVFRMQPKPGKEQEILARMQQWERDRMPEVKGAIAGLLYKLDNGGLMGVAVFASQEDYRANAADPQQHEWFQGMREMLESDPEWNDGEIINQWGSL